MVRHDSVTLNLILVLHPVLQVILPEVWETAADLFDASRAGVVSDRKRTQKVQEKVGVSK